ncbi:hypothetical protein [Clostridium sp. UBA6640]|uniref:hypothetical protein n=1 Tax=Clostridium sp. UBA6640 TaxID=1946370 RepID=UPI0025C52D3F|nr:hypothetical protein [Clostridium sp. UBA6640]
MGKNIIKNIVILIVLLMCSSKIAYAVELINNNLRNEELKKISKEYSQEWTRFLDIIENDDITYEDKSKVIMGLLRSCDGQGGPKTYSSKVNTILAPKLPSDYDEAKLFQILKDQNSIIKNTNPIEVTEFIKSWSSGNGEKPRRFNDDISNYLEALFKAININFPDTKLNLIDLFHGHMVIDESYSNGDVLIIFHSKEYPSNLEKQKTDIAIKEDSKLQLFDTKNGVYKKRNYIWSLRKNKIWRIDTSEESGFCNLVKSPIYDFCPEEVMEANAAQESYLGKTICDINYFIDYNGAEVKPFVTQGAGTPQFP